MVVGSSDGDAAIGSSRNGDKEEVSAGSSNGCCSFTLLTRVPAVCCVGSGVGCCCCTVCDGGSSLGLK